MIIYSPLTCSHESSGEVLTYCGYGEVLLRCETYWIDLSVLMMSVLIIRRFFFFQTVDCLQTHLSRRTHRRKMLLFDLPDEVLVHIATFLDTESHIAFCNVNRRMYAAARNSRKLVKTSYVTKSFMEWIYDNGSSIRHLDVSNCIASFRLIERILLKCRHVTELNVINSSIFNIRSIFDLRELQKLSVTSAACFFNGFNPAFASIRELRFEVEPTRTALEFVMRLLNFCENIEVVHLNMVGMSSNLDEALPALAAERWRTLHTVVCSRVLSCGSPSWILSLLGAIFAHHEAPRIRGKIEEGIPECFVYEHGHCNLDIIREIPVDDNVKLLKRFHSVYLPLGGNSTELFASSWSSARSLRVIGHQFLLSRMTISLSMRLTELDLTACHGNYTESFRLNLIASTPSLQVLAYPLCLFLPLEPEKLVEEDAVPLERKSFADALGKLRLRKLVLRGVCHAGNCAEICSCNIWDCERCTAPLTSGNLIDLSTLNHLEEMTLSGVNLEDSAYEKLAGDNLKIVRLCLNARSNYFGLEAFIRRCSRLERFKLEGHLLDVTSEQLWTTLAQGVNLKQLCIGTGSTTRPCDPPKFSPELCEAFWRILIRVDFMHLHIQHDDDALADRFSRIVSSKTIDPRIKGYLMGRIVFVRHPYRRRWEYPILSRHRVRGRRICIPESFIGIMPPTGWD